MMKVVLIPGMDGTGTLFDPFIESVPTGIEVISLPLLQRSDAGYEDQARHIIGSIGEQPIVLVAESYSGMVAYNMLKMGCSNIQHVVFAASFITRPSGLVSIAQYLPVGLLKSRAFLGSLVGTLLFGKFSTPELVELFYGSLNSVSNNVLKSRMYQIAKLPVPRMPISVPCTYIRPKGDKLVSKRAIEPFQNLCQKLSVYEVDGTHFVLQTNPEIGRAHV
jgi:surfactin synthase thioesterase subunit